VRTGRISLLGFELRQALAKGDTATSDGRVRVFEEVRQIMSRASSLKEREEEIPLVADRLRLSSDSVALLLQGGPRASSRTVRAGRDGAQQSLAQRLLGSETAVERDFLVAAACNPVRAIQILEALTPEHFADPSNREVFAGLRDAFALVTDQDDHRAAFAQLQERARADSEAGALFVRLVIEADQGRYSPGVLEELHLRLQEQHLNREIAVLRGMLDDGGDRAAEQRRLVHLERLLQSVRTGLKDLDPEEGRA
jgi:DNA primase